MTVSADIQFAKGIKFHFRYFTPDVYVINCMLQLDIPVESRELSRVLSPVVSKEEVRSGLLRMKQRGIVKTQYGRKRHESCKWYIPEGMKHGLSVLIREKYAAELSGLQPLGTCRGIESQG